MKSERAVVFITVFLIYFGVALSMLVLCVLLSIAVLVGNRIIGV